MTKHDTNQLDHAIARVYAGALEDFIKRRDSLAKELSTGGDRDAAATVKALRKPSRTSWALNLAAGDAENLGRLDAAIAATLKAQSSGGDVRAALASFREAVRQFADHATQEAERAGLSLGTATLMNAVLAVIGRTDDLEALRRGRLVDVPEGGGLDFMAALPGSLPTPESHAPAAARARAEARERSELAQAALREAESRLRLAEGRLRAAESEVKEARRDYERARLEVESNSTEA